MKNKLIMIIDLDSPVYRAACAVKDGESVVHALHNIKIFMESLYNWIGHSKYVGFLSEADNVHWRHDIYPLYKANRKKTQRPLFYPEVREYLFKYYNVELVKGMEADDRVAIEQTKYLTKVNGNELCKSVIVGMDKDLRQIPGWHYEYAYKTSGGKVKEEKFYYIKELDAYKEFYTQMLVGDRADNVPRIKPRWRSGETELKLKQTSNLHQLKSVFFQTVKDLYPDKSIEELLDLINLRGKLLWLKRHDNDEFKFEMEEINV